MYPAITVMFASQETALLARPELLLRLFPPLLVFFGVNLLLGMGVNRFARWDYGACANLCFATLSRNSPVALAIAVAAFPERPLIALALVIGPLIALPVITPITQILRWYTTRPQHQRVR